MSYMQLVGTKPGDTMIFVRVSETFHDQVYLDKFNKYIVPIYEKDYDFWIKHYPVCGRYEVTKMKGYSDVYEASEAHRDAYPFHLPGFKFISTLNVGTIIPMCGFSAPQFLSDGDVALLQKHNI